MSAELLLALGYAGALTAAAFALEWLSEHTHRRALRFRTAGFTYHDTQDYWLCPQGEQLWPREVDRERRLVRYRARAHVCNACARKERCTDSDRGREIVRPIDPWPRSEAGRFHRVVALTLVGLAAFILVVELARNRSALGVAATASLLAAVGVAARCLLRDLRAHPVGAPGARREARRIELAE